MKCEKCGRETGGSWSEGGVKWAICEDCYGERPTEKKDRNGEVGMVVNGSELSEGREEREAAHKWRDCRADRSGGDVTYPPPEGSVPKGGKGGCGC